MAIHQALMYEGHFSNKNHFVVHTERLCAWSNEWLHCVLSFLGTTAFSYSCVSSLYILFCIFKMFKLSNFPPHGRCSQLLIICRKETCLLQTFSSRFVKFKKLLPCVKARCIREKEIFKLVMTLLAGFGPLPLQPRPYAQWFSSFLPSQTSSL